MTRPLFDAGQELANRIQLAPHLLLCLDYDGTLTHFVDDPLGASLSPQMNRALRALADNKRVSLAIFSGRDRADLQSRVGIPHIFYVGNHGLEISGSGLVFIEPTAVERSETLGALAAALKAKLQAIPGVVVEYKGVTLSVHYRQAAPEASERIRRLVHATLAGAIHPFILTQGEKVYEIRPRVYWNKGSAVAWIRKHLDQPEVLPIYVGDSVTDEDAFTAIADGITVRVRPRADTAARYSLEDPTEVRKLLEWIDDLLRQRK
jgi:trehalose-phosphatase